MAESVYLTAALLSALCAVMLFRGYRRNGLSLLLWSGLCFLGLSLNNALLFVDIVVVPSVDISVFRSLSALIGLTLLIYGLVSEAA